MKPRDNGAVLLSSRQLTITVQPNEHAMLTDLARLAGCSLHEAATRMLAESINATHYDLKLRKLTWLLCHWVTWGSVDSEA